MIVSNFVIVPESIVEDAAAACSDDEHNSFRKVLRAAEEFKKAEMTPIFILDIERMDLIVVTKETFQKKLN